MMIKQMLKSLIKKSKNLNKPMSNIFIKDPRSSKKPIIARALEPPYSYQIKSILTDKL